MTALRNSWIDKSPIRFIQVNGERLAEIWTNQTAEVHGDNRSWLSSGMHKAHFASNLNFFLKSSLLFCRGISCVDNLHHFPTFSFLPLRRQTLNICALPQIIEEIQHVEGVVILENVPRNLLF